MKDKGTHSGVKSFYIKDEFLNMKLEFSFDEKVDAWHYPIETVSLSEGGVERLYQHSMFIYEKN